MKKITAFLCKSEDKKIFELSLSPKGITSILTLPGISKLGQNVEIMNLGGLLVHDFFRDGYDQILVLKKE